MTIESTLKERGERYGDFADHAKIAQALQDVARDAEGWVRLDAAQRQALTVICDKIARILSGDPTYADNWHDIQGYAKLVEDRLPVGETNTPPLWTRETAAVDTLERQGYEWKGGEVWAPPLGKVPLDLPVVEMPASMRCGDAINVPSMEVPKPWYPDNGGWVEVADSVNKLPDRLRGQDEVEVLCKDEREYKSFEPYAKQASAWEWDLHPDAFDRIVAYKVV